MTGPHACVSSWCSALVLAGLVGIASACAPDGVRYTVVPTAEPALTQPAVAAPAAPTGNRQLDAFLSHFASAVDRRDWYAIARMLDGRAYADLHDAAVAEGETPEAASAALIADAIGLRALVTSSSTPFSELNQIRVVTLRETTALPNGVIRIQGDVRLADDRRAVLSAFVRQATDTRSYRIILSRV